jgi:hypothetical protein
MGFANVVIHQANTKTPTSGKRSNTPVTIIQWSAINYSFRIMTAVRKQNNGPTGVHSIVTAIYNSHVKKVKSSHYRPEMA